MLKMILTRSAAALLLALTVTLAGCGKTENQQQVNKLKIFSGSNQYTLPGEEFSKELVVTAEGPGQKGLLGNTSVRPAANAKLKIQLPITAARASRPFASRLPGRHRRKSRNSQRKISVLIVIPIRKL